MKDYLINRILSRIYTYRFELFLTSQIAILFGSLIIPSESFEIVSPILFYLNIIAGSLFLGTQEKTQVWVIFFVLIIIGGVFALSELDTINNHIFNFLRIIVLFIFHLIVTYKIIKQVWQADLVNKKVIFGVISGFISLGFIGFFIFISIEVGYPESFTGLTILNNSTNTLTERLMYFSYITLLTIGYGEILPVTLLAQKATILIGLIGQFYLVIITAIIVGKFINQTTYRKADK